MLLGKQRKGEDIREVDQDPDAESSEEDYEPISLLLAKQRNGPTEELISLFAENTRGLKFWKVNQG